MRNTRVRIAETARRGDSVEVRVMIMHPMDTGYTYTTQGTVIPMNIVTDFVCRYLGEEVIRVRMEPGLSANPYFAFQLRADESGPVEFVWTDQHGEETSTSARLTVT